MTKNHPLEEFVKKIEKAFEAIENPEMIPFLEKDPDVQVSETEEEIKLSLNLHDLNPDEVQVQWLDGQMIFSTVNMDTETVNAEDYAPFTYQLALPSNVDPFSIAIEFVDDTLEVQFTKASLIMVNSA